MDREKKGAARDRKGCLMRADPTQHFRDFINALFMLFVHSCRQVQRALPQTHHTHTDRQKQTRKTPAVRNPPNVNHGQFQNKLFLIIINKKRGSKKGNEI
jgi:hypothetical protein